MKLRRFWQRHRLDLDASEELASHLAHEIDENLARGLTSDAARTAAVRKFGNATHIREEIYEMNTVQMLDALWQDLRFSFRQLRLKPGFAVTAILSLAL